MSNFKNWIAQFSLASISVFAANSAHADYTNRFTLGVGVAAVGNPSTTSFEAGLEYENKFDSFFGLGVSGNYIFSNPNILLLAVPDVFFHPFTGDFLVSAAPLLEFGSGTGTNLGVRLGTRLPIPLGLFTIVPSFAVDFINGGHDYIFGLGVSF